MPVTVAPDTEELISITWSTVGKELGEYKAAAYVFANGKAFDPEYRTFEIKLELAPPTAASSATGAPKDTYSTDEDVYAAGSGFADGTNVDIYVVHDRDWNDGDPIPADVTGSVETVSIVNGDVGPVLVWNAPLTPGRYDIVIDANRNAVYDASTDGLDSGSPGFIVIADAPPSPPVSVPALAPAGIVR